ncbi:hypothetical protein [Hoylesella timonensis]|uniref:Uncharacterized protein n=1 Tax=Hoylesella timonensis S9-PR14 TaxID=1401062 RepID=A0A098YRK0_9BACT|nr:hypothetical protein [Hoylesella timonensis]KGI21882.1 hypothetical protein HMPREF9304_07620 [Hoylesella timonensis S9-PR14]
MIAKIIQGTDFNGVINYMLNRPDDKAKVLAATGVRSTLANDIAHDFNLQASASSKTKCNKRVVLAERCRRSRSVARGCLHLSARKKQPAIQIKKGRPLSPQD